MTKTTRKPYRESSGNIFIDLGFPPHEAAVMLLRCELAEALRKWIDREGSHKRRLPSVWRSATTHL